MILRLEDRESCAVALQLSFLFCKASWQSCLQFTARSWTGGVDYSISDGGDKFVFWSYQWVVGTGYRGFRLRSTLYTSLKKSMWLSDTNLQNETGIIVKASGSHSMGRDPNEVYNFAKCQKLGCAEAIKKRNLGRNFSKLSVCICSVA